MAANAGKSLTFYLRALRAQFFTGSILPVLLGTSFAYYKTGLWDWTLFLLAETAMVLLHAGANAANDYFDHVSGTDDLNVDFVSPFTGGSRMIQAGLMSPRETLVTAGVCFSVAAVIGLALATLAGGFVIVLGAVGMLGGFFYTAPPLKLSSRGLGEPAIAFNFGILPVAGAYYLQTRSIGAEVVLLAIPLALLITAVLFINQFQDFNADSETGKRNWVVRLGKRRAAPLYLIIASSWALPLLAGVLCRIFPPAMLFSLVPFLLLFLIVPRLILSWNGTKSLAPVNAMTIAMHLCVGVMMSACAIFARWTGT